MNGDTHTPLSSNPGTHLLFPLNFINMLHAKPTFILTSGIATAVLIGSHYLFPLIKRIKWLKPNVVTSFASGLVVAYVFLHMLPGLVESRDHIHALLAKTTLMSQSKDLIIFIAALIGFEIFYFVERLSLGNANSVTDMLFERRNYHIHLWMYFIYNFLITYSLELSAEASVFYTAIYVIAVALHFILTDNHFHRHFKHFVGTRTQLFLISGLVLGYVLSIFLYPVKLYIAAIFTAALAGAILYNTFKEEITLTRETSSLSFFMGTLIIGVLLALHLTH